MKHLLLAVCFTPFFVFSQSKLPLKDPGVTVEWKVKDRPQTQQLRKLATCGVDTVYYVQAKTTNWETKILYSDNSYASQAGQFYHASTSNPITVHGFTWYGYAFDPLGGGPTLNIDCSIYAAGSDSLPTGSALATETISVDTNQANQTHQVVFSTPVVMTDHYVLVVSNPNTEWLFIASNDEDAGDGGGWRLSSNYYEPANSWFKNEDLWALGDFDMIMEPYVTYSLNANFNISASSCVGTPETFTNTTSGPMTVFFYNQDQLFGNPKRWHWTYGDGNFDNYQKNGANTYASPGSYNVTLIDTINMWTGWCIDSKTEVLDVFAVPAAPVGSAGAPVCEYTPAADLTATGSGTDFHWYTTPNLNPVNEIGTGSPFSSGITQADTIYVTEVVNGCESPADTVEILFLSNPIPVFTPVPQGNETYQFTGAPAATGYAWDFGDGMGTSTQQTPTYQFALGGPFNVCLDITYSNGCTNQYCESIAWTSISEHLDRHLAIYPNPFSQTFHISADEYVFGADMVITDVAGRQIYSDKITWYESDITLDALASGSYYVTIIKDREIGTMKLVKQ